ncbi:MaoC/PaaZ C-terminal domain-containing protein [Sporichthya sp.]|uniref:MaoC/PaaZ C-terminal domain-containing protein n=1 Tax=Sporichthya sp. TaxID=65475 RepID=UPI001849A506|nr:MaoC/PaaZ C-terminal domain-containing protein [Sporichthya sp.]MBA3745706.1 dehydratase [Sporichthya sp.]
MSAPTWAGVEKGTALPSQTFTFRRGDLVRYAGASGDFNVIHWNDRIAAEVGLPNVLAHGMLTMGTVARVVTDWAGDPGAVTEYGVRFTRPVPVPDDSALDGSGGGSTVEVSAEVTDKLEDNLVKVTIKATYDGATVLAKAIAIVRLP